MGWEALGKSFDFWPWLFLTLLEIRTLSLCSGRGKNQLSFPHLPNPPWLPKWVVHLLEQLHIYMWLRCTFPTRCQPILLASGGRKKFGRGQELVKEGDWPVEGLFTTEEWDTCLAFLSKQTPAPQVLTLAPAGSRGLGYYMECSLQLHQPGLENALGCLVWGLVLPHPYSWYL